MRPCKSKGNKSKVSSTDTEVENLGTSDEQEKEAGVNCHEVDSAQENGDSDDEASDRSERPLVQVC